MTKKNTFISILVSLPLLLSCKLQRSYSFSEESRSDYYFSEEINLENSYLTVKILNYQERNITSEFDLIYFSENRFKIHSIRTGSLASRNIDTTFTLSVPQEDVLNSFILKVKGKKEISKGAKIAGSKSIYNIMINGINYEHKERGVFSLLDAMLLVIVALFC